MCEASADLRRPHNDVLGFHSPIGQVHGSVLIVAVDVGSDPVSQVSTEVSHGLSEIDGMLRVEVIHTKFGSFDKFPSFINIYTPRLFTLYPKITDNSHLRYIRSKSERAPPHVFPRTLIAPVLRMSSQVGKRHRTGCPRSPVRTSPYYCRLRLHVCTMTTAAPWPEQSWLLATALFKPELLRERHTTGHNIASLPCTR